jgi:hypothetical protein
MEHINLSRANDFINNDNHIFGLSKKEKERKAAKKAAIAEAKNAGLSNRQARMAGRSAKLEVKADQKGNVKAAARIAGRAAKIDSKIALLDDGRLSKSEKITARKAGQEVQVKALQNAVADGKISGKKAEAILKKAERVSARDGKTLIGRAIETAEYAPLIPLIPVMNKALKNKGIAPPSPIDKKAQLFYNEIVAQSKNSYENYPKINFSNYDADHILPAIPVIVQSVINFVKGIKKQNDKVKVLTEQVSLGVDGAETKLREAEMKLTKDDAELAIEVEKVEDKIIAAELDKGTPINQFLREYGVYIIAAIVAIYVLPKVLK